MRVGVVAFRAIRERINTDRNERTLRPLLDVTPTAENLFFPFADPDFIEWFAPTPDVWDDIPTRNPPYRQRGTGFLVIRFYADYKVGPTSTPYTPPRGCYLANKTLRIAGTEGRIEITTRTSDPQAGPRLIRIVEEEFARLGVQFMP